MDERIWTIAEILDQSGPMTADELAAQLKLSGKTVRSLIKTYAKEMQENGFCITAKPGRGFGIEITDAQTYVSGSKPQQGEQTGIPQDAQERIQRLRQYLLEKDGYSKLDDLSEQFFVSRRSISNDLREVERQLAEYGLSIRRKPGYGICVVGRETNRRICIAAQRDESRPVGQQIQELVSRVLEKEKFAMSTMALDNLAVHLEVAVERIRTGHAIESSDGMQADLPERILEVASHIAVQIENMTGVAFPLPEVCYIAMHLNGKQMYRANAMTSDENLVIPQEVNRIVSDMIEHIYEAFRIDFRDNLELRMGLCMHMVPLLARIKSGMRMKNPILQDIKREYPLAYEMATQACSVLQDVSPNPIKEDEIGYIAVSFALALERQKAKEWAPKNILIVCASGKGSAQLLAYRYQQKFGKNLGRVQTCDVIGLRSVNFSKIDYVFSTVPIPIYVPVPIRQIQFFPTEKELTQMKKLLMQGKKGNCGRIFQLGAISATSQLQKHGEQVLEQMCRFVCRQKKLPDDFLQLVKKRESLAATSFGGLVAMPHPWKAVSKDTFVCLAILDKPVQWGEAKVQVVFLVSIADDATAKLQKFYQVVAQLMVDEACICKLICRAPVRGPVGAAETKRTRTGGTRKWLMTRSTKLHLKLSPALVMQNHWH